jgi:hypothetical protein
MADEHDRAVTGATGETAAEDSAAPETEGGAGNGAGGASRFPVIIPMRNALREEATIIDEWPAPRPRPVAAAPWMRWFRSRAAVIAIAAATGAVVGAGAAAGIGAVLPPADDGPGAEEAVEALRTSIGQLANEIKALKAGVGEGSRAAVDGLAAIEDRVAAAESAQTDLAGEVATLAKGLAQQPLAAPQVSDEVTGSITRGKLAVAQDWVLWRVRNGRALVQGNGGYFEVVPGSQLPGLGLVQRIVKADGRWMVLTRNGVIVARG